MLKDLLVKVNMEGCKSLPSPMVTSGSVFDNPKLHRRIIGGLQYACITKADISYSVNKLS